MVYITDGLLDTLLELADGADPMSVTIRLAVTSADDLDGDAGLADDASVFTDLYFPASGDSIEAVFGVDVSVPPGQTQGVFISHPDGLLDLSTTDDFAEVVLIAVPPYTRDGVAAFDRGGRELPIRIVDAADIGLAAEE